VLSETVQAVVPCRMDYLDGVVALLESICRGTDETVRIQIVTAFNEAFSNVVRHSQLTEQDAIEVCARRQGEQISVQILDRGVIYGDVFEASKQSGDVMALQEGGMGLFIIHQYMHEVTYERGERNKLSMVRYLDRELEVQ
jgi:anti-sigma regulatory factor (Ser/Thr protein kinase)